MSSLVARHMLKYKITKSEMMKHLPAKEHRSGYYAEIEECRFICFPNARSKLSCQVDDGANKNMQFLFVHTNISCLFVG
jgi:hypothetical protein